MDRVLTERLDKLEGIVGSNHQKHEFSLNQLRIGQLEQQRTLQQMQKQLDENSQILAPFKAMLTLKVFMVGLLGLATAIFAALAAFKGVME